MQSRKLGQTDIEVSVVAMGCWAIAGGRTWGDQDEDAISPAVDAALDAGVNFFDTAPGYGESERLLGDALGDRRNEAVIATKISEGDCHPDDVVASADRSLAALGGDAIDLLQIHWPNRDVPFADTFGALQRLVDAGKVRAIGVSNFGPLDLAAAVGECSYIATNQLAYNLLARMLEYDIQPLCARHDIGILCYSPLMQGLLAGKFASVDDVPDGRARTRHFSGDRPEARHGEPGCEAETFEAIAKIRVICNEIGQPMDAVALAWCLAQPSVTAVLAGMRNAEQAKRNAAAGELVLSDEVVQRLNDATEPVKQKLGSNAYMWAAESRMR